LLACGNLAVAVTGRQLVPLRGIFSGRRAPARGRGRCSGGDRRFDPGLPDSSQHEPLAAVRRLFELLNRVFELPNCRATASRKERQQASARVLAWATRQSLTPPVQPSLASHFAAALFWAEGIGLFSATASATAIPIAAQCSAA